MGIKTPWTIDAYETERGGPDGWSCSFGGIVKKRDAIPAKVRQRMRAHQRVVAQRGQAHRKR